MVRRLIIKAVGGGKTEALVYSFLRSSTSRAGSPATSASCWTGRRRRC